MPSTTSNLQLPYPVNGDKVSDYPAIAEPMAKKLDKLLTFGSASGPAAAANGTGTVVITVPSHTVNTSAPQISIEGPDGIADRLFAAIIGHTTTSLTVKAKNTTAVAVAADTYKINWLLLAL